MCVKNYIDKKFIVQNVKKLYQTKLNFRSNFIHLIKLDKNLVLSDHNNKYKVSIQIHLTAKQIFDSDHDRN
jgi:hypothetical protein